MSVGAHPVVSAVARYDELLARADVAGLWEEFQARMRENLMFFGGRPVCNVLRPHFLHPQDFAAIAGAAKAVISALHKVYRALRENPEELQGRLYLSEAEAELTRLPDYCGPPDASARIDAFWAPGEVPGQGRLTFLEYNADSPGGLAFGDVLSQLFLELRPLRELEREFRLQTAPVRERVYDTLLACWRDWAQEAGRTVSGAPHIAIVDWRTVRTRNEFILSEQVFERRGSRTAICDPDELEYSGGRLHAGGDFPVDIVYKRVVVNEFIERLAEAGGLMEHPLVRAAGDHAVCVVNGFNVQLLYNKALFALLGEEAFQPLFTAEEQRALQRHIPWSRLFQEGRTSFEGREVDLPEFAAQRKEDLVLKPIRLYGGTGVMLGWEHEQLAWEAALKRALEEPHVLQQRVPTPREMFPIYSDGLSFVSRTVDVDPYVWRGREVDHAGVRLGTGDLLNVSAGGSATPMFLVEPR